MPSSLHQIRGTLGCLSLSMLTPCAWRRQGLLGLCREGILSPFLHFSTEGCRGHKKYLEFFPGDPSGSLIQSLVFTSAWTCGRSFYPCRPVLLDFVTGIV